MDLYDDRTLPPPELTAANFKVPEPTHWIVKGKWRAADQPEWTRAGHPLVEALLDAYRYHINGTTPTIMVSGWVPGFGTQIGGGDAGLKAYRAHWDGTPMSFNVVGHGPRACIPEFTLFRESGGENTGGIMHARFVNLTIRNEWADRCIGSASQDQLHGDTWGLLDLENVHFIANPDRKADGEFGGYGKKFGIRCTARMAYRVVGCVDYGSQEHFCYVNTAQADPAWGGSMFVGNELLGSSRTMFQIVNRANENVPDLVTSHLLFADNTARDIRGDGGGSITVAGGHTGPITIINHRMLNCQHAGVVVWHDRNVLHGTPKGEDGFSNGDVVIDGLHFDEQSRVSNQQQVQVNSARSCRIGRRWRIRSYKAAFDFSNIGNGPWFEWKGPLVEHPGFAGPGRKIKMDTADESNKTLTDAEINALGTPGTAWE